MSEGVSSTNGTHILFINLKSNRHSRTRNYFNGLRRMGIACDWLDVGSFGELRSRQDEINQHLDRGSRIVITSPSHVLVPFFILIFHRRPIFDAGWTLYDGVISSRRQYGFLASNILKTLLIDFLSLHLASRVLVESEAQQKSILQRYLVYKNRLSVLLTGFDEERLDGVSSKKNDGEVCVLFRGGAQDEAGLEVLDKAIRKLENERELKFKLITNRYKPRAPFGANVELLNEYVSDEELGKAFREADLVLGQLSNHKRLNRTIPHKFFEAAYLGKPYLSSDKGLMGDLGKLSIIYVFSGGNSDDLAQSILRIVGDLESAKKVGDGLREWYLKNASQRVLSQRFLEIVCEK